MYRGDFMAKVYLSPSTQEYNQYIDEGNEEYWMNIIVDKMEPYLKADGIEFDRNDPNTSAATAIRESNNGDYDLHFALHSNASPASLAGRMTGSDVYYYPYSTKGKRAADIIADNLKKIYPNPDKVRALPTTTIGEVRKTRAPAVLVELAYHDNPEDAAWIRNNTDEIAENLADSIAKFLYS